MFGIFNKHAFIYLNLNEFSDTGAMDLVSLSFWFSQNAVLSAENRRRVFITDSVLSRLIIIANSLDVSLINKKLTSL